MASVKLLLITTKKKNEGKKKKKKKKKNLLKELKHFIHFQVYGFILGNYGIVFSEH